MGKYFGSPWGYIRGKVNDAVGGVWKGIEWLRVRVFPTQRGTLELLRLLDQGLIPPERFSYEQFNIRRLVLQVLGWIGTTNRPNLIYPVWDRLCKKRLLKLTGINLFVRRSAPYLWESLPSKDKRYHPVTNKPDMRKMVVSDGDLEPSPAITKCEYKPATGVLKIEFDDTVYKNGKPTDIALAVAYVEPIIDAEWRPNGWLYGTAVVPPPPAVPKMRLHKEIDLFMAKGLDPDVTPIYGYLFFRDAEDVIGYSPSISARAT